MFARPFSPPTCTVLRVWEADYSLTCWNQGVATASKLKSRIWLVSISWVLMTSARPSLFPGRWNIVWLGRLGTSPQLETVLTVCNHIIYVYRVYWLSDALMVIPNLTHTNLMSTPVSLTHTVRGFLLRPKPMRESDARGSAHCYAGYESHILTQAQTENYFMSEPTDQEQQHVRRRTRRKPDCTKSRHITLPGGLATIVRTS